MYCLEWGQLQAGMFYLFGYAAGCKLSSRKGAVFPLWTHLLGQQKEKEDPFQGP